MTKIINFWQLLSMMLSTITFSNVRSLLNKMTELAVLVKYNRDYCQSRLICVTVSWLTRLDRH